VNGVELAYVEQGAGDALVFVHGALSDYRSWLEMGAPFAARYRTITYSRRAHFPNAWPAGYTASDPEVHAADLAALVEALGLGPAHLFGHSIGGVTTLVLAARRPELVRTLVLGEPALFGWLGATAEGRALRAAFAAAVEEPARRAFERGDPEAGVRAFIDGVFGDGAFAAAPPEVRAVTLDNAPEMRVELATPPETLFSSLTREDVGRLRAPTLLLAGELSPPIYRFIGDELARARPDAERVTLPGVSHDLYNPAAFQGALLDFFARHG
jgi:pimeloyl-ACP methyl ester carboxylesterase